MLFLHPKNLCEINGHDRGVATVEDGGEGPAVSVSNIRSIALYGCSEIKRTRNFTIFTVYAAIFGPFTAVFHFFNYIRGIDHFTLDFLERFDT